VKAFYQWNPVQHSGFSGHIIAVSLPLGTSFKSLNMQADNSDTCCSRSFAVAATILTWASKGYKSLRGIYDLLKLWLNALFAPSAFQKSFQRELHLSKRNEK
jgi:hypothetical protein